MQYSKPKPKSQLEKIFLDQVDADTPESIKTNRLLDLNNEQEFTFTLTRELVDSLGISAWFENYSKEAKVSTAGIRGMQNPLYPWDTRYPLNLVGVTLATMGKILVAGETSVPKIKITANEVRYNSEMFVELISRLQAANRIKTYVTNNYQEIPIFLISFIIFMYDLYGGEYVTSSHAICRKIATKDLNNQGSQYIPSESLKFLKKVGQILTEVKTTGQYIFHFSAKAHDDIDTRFLPSINNGINSYVDYLKKGIATPVNIQYIKDNPEKIIVECMGGSMYTTLAQILEQLGIFNNFDFFHKEKDPYNFGIGKVIDSQGKFFDWGCDTTIMQADLNTMKITLPVIDTIDYKKLLKDYPIGTTILITDPDADRLVTAYIEKSDLVDVVKQRGLVYTELDQGRIFVMFTPNQSFLMTLDFHQSALNQSGLWHKYNWFLLKTTASQRSWDEWAQNNNIPVVNTPVGFKELADTMQHVEQKMTTTVGHDIEILDVFGNVVNLGKNPRMLFAGEESGGKIFGPPELISSIHGRKAISMREKSAGEAVIITSAMVSWLSQKHLSLSDYLWEIYDHNHIKSRYEIRLDHKYYNESELDIVKMLEDKKQGILTRTLNNTYFLGLTLSFRDKIINLDQVKEILGECFPELNFTDLIDLKFVGDGNLFLFNTKCVEVRPSGTDAINKSYSYGTDQWECIRYARNFSAYPGTRNPLHIKYIPLDFYRQVEDYAFEIYSRYKENQ